MVFKYQASGDFVQDIDPVLDRPLPLSNSPVVNTPTSVDLPASALPNTAIGCWVHILDCSRV